MLGITPFSMKRNTAELFLAAIPVAVYLVISLPHLDMVPMWDGYLYATCLAGTHSMIRYLAGCFGHATLGWSTPLILVLHVFPGSAVAVNLVQIAFGAVGVAAFQRLLASLWPERSAAAVNIAVATVFATDPVLAGNLLNSTPDNGVLVYDLLVLMFLARGQLRAAALAGFLLVLSKETGVAYYLVAILAWSMWRRYAAADRSSWRELRAEIAVLALPVVIFAGATIAKGFYLGRSVWLGVASSSDLVSELVRVDVVFLRLLAAIFIVNFAWISLAWIAAESVRRGIRRMRGKDAGGTHLLGPILVMLAIVVYLSTRLVLGHASPRYIMVCLPLVALALRECLNSIPFLRVRVGIPAVLVLLHLSSLYAPADPVSRWTLGVFPVGRREMYETTAAPWNFRMGTEGLHREELIYNLQFTGLHRLFDEVLAGHCSADCPLLTNFNRGTEDFGVTTDGESRRSWPGDHAPAVCQQSEVFRDIRLIQMSENTREPSTPCLVYASFPHCRWMDAHFEQVIREWGYARTAVDTVVVDGYAADVATYRLEVPAR